MNEVNQRTLTTGERQGSGIFDELMRSMQSHIDYELKSGRITEQTYSQIYLGGLQQVLQVASQYSLSLETTNLNNKILVQQLEKQTLENEIQKENLEQAKVNTKLLNHQLTVTQPKEDLILDENKLLIQAQTLAQTASANLADEQILTEGEKRKLIQEQIQTEKMNTVTPTQGLAKAQYDKTMQEVAVLTQKKETEKAQTSGALAINPNNPSSTEVGGLIGREMNLKQVQAENFLRDAEQKAAKMYSDAFNMLTSIDAENINAQNYGLGSDESFEVMAKLLEGIGARAPNRDLSPDHRTTD